MPPLQAVIPVILYHRPRIDLVAIPCLNPIDMKRLFTSTFAIVIALVALSQVVVPVKREQRAVWASSYVSDWPSGAITERNAATMRLACERMLDTLHVNHMNAIYYHVRAFCDAMYNSAYEPWSKYVAGTRGTTPYFDPFELLVNEAHKRGIEVYAWVNPYRYAPKNSSWGESELDYIYTHPEWLMKDDYETVLNPGLPEVRQRIVDVCQDIITKYDVDGLVFDDYFYNQDGASMDLDADLYNAYKQGGGTLSQGDWRRENVNQMVADVNNMVKQVKPWVRFGIGPAGVACSAASVAAKYGVDPSPGSDWQYNQIYSDPMAWVSRGTIDFLAPQVYWNTAGNYDEVTGWWGKIGQKFNRHIFISSYAVEGVKDGWGLDEYLKQVEIMRESMTNGVFGTVYFKYMTWRMLTGKLTEDGKGIALRHYLKTNVYKYRSLSPSVTWVQPPVQYGTVTGLQRDGDTLRWDAVDNVRYVAYAIPDSVSDAQFQCQPEYMLDMTYGNTFAIPAAKAAAHRYAVTILDRWENEYAPVTVGATVKEAPVPSLEYPAQGATVPELTMLRWTSANPACTYTLQLAKDEAMTDVVASVAVDSMSCPLRALSGITTGKYYWRVIARGLNLTDAASAVQSFNVEQLKVQAPVAGATDVPLTTSISCSKVEGDASYHFELSLLSSMATTYLSFDSKTPEVTMPRYMLAGATTYYVRVTASMGGHSATSAVSSFRTAEVVPPVPTYTNLDTDGTTQYPGSVFTFKPEEGASSLRVEIASTTAFPARSSYKGTLDHGVFESPRLGDITGVGKLTDGKTYYVRARYAYNTVATGNTVQFTEYSPVHSFVYSASLPGDVNGDGAVDVTDANLIINAILGKDVEGNTDVNGDGTVDVSDINMVINIILGK